MNFVTTVTTVTIEKGSREERRVLFGEETKSRALFCFLMPPMILVVTVVTVVTCLISR